jgi:hypothetical protein
VMMSQLRGRLTHTGVNSSSSSWRGSRGSSEGGWAGAATPAADVLLSKSAERSAAADVDGSSSIGGCPAHQGGPY